ncbi:MAG: hypothetical protein E7523_10320 [Ruminococcaceae bacterium]|nr:hypothetical protein [Oscillospiraceae bacterium]
MKKIIAMSLSVLLVLSLVISFAGCMDDTPDQEEPTTVFVRMDTVPEENVVSYINSVIEKSNASGAKINVSESFSVNDPKALTDEDYAAYLNGKELAGNEALDTLDDTLGFIKTYLMKGFSAPAPEITALATIDNADVAAVVNYNDKTARNWTTENVTDEEGETIAYEEDVPKYEFDMDGNELLDQPVTDENGEQQYYGNGDVMSKTFVCDNKMRATLSFLAQPAEETTAIQFADSAVINKYFTNTVDKEYVLSELAKVNTAVAINDYSVEYRDCTVTFEIDMETEQVLNATYTKNAFVTFEAKGEGSFADLGEFKICFTFTDTVTCTFDYAAAEDVVDNETTVENDAVLTDGDVLTNGDVITNGDAITDGDVLTDGDVVEFNSETETVPEITIEATEVLAE